MSGADDLHPLHAVYFCDNVDFIILVADNVNYYFYVLLLVKFIAIAARSVFLKAVFGDFSKLPQKAFNVHLSRIIHNRLDAVGA